MNFSAHTQEELHKLQLTNDSLHTIEYLNRDYFNGEENIEISKARVIVNDNDILFVVTDPYGMDKFIKEARIIS